MIRKGLTYSGLESLIEIDIADICFVFKLKIYQHKDHALLDRQQRSQRLTECKLKFCNNVYTVVKSNFF